MAKTVPPDGGKPDEQYTEEETVRRRDAAMRRALSTPPKPQKPHNAPDKEGAKDEAARLGERPAGPAAKNAKC